MKKSTTEKPSLTLHNLLGALSFWGTATRTFLFSFLAVAVFVAALSEVTTTSGADTQVMMFIYVMASFVLLDFGYVMIARAYPLPKVLDIMALLTADALVALLYITPKVVVSQSIVVRIDPLMFVIFIPIVALGLRMLLGILFSTQKR